MTVVISDEMTLDLHGHVIYLQGKSRHYLSLILVNNADLKSEKVLTLLATNRQLELRLRSTMKALVFTEHFYAFYPQIKTS